MLGCRSTYYGQAIRGQWQILAHRKPIRALLASPQIPASLAAKLKLILQLREFALRELKLPANGHFLSYVDVHRAHVLWNVVAAPEFSLQAKTWWYPLVGRLKYRGYFAEEDARHYAARLKKKGWDIYVGGVDAYSTLGWFRESVLNTFVVYNEVNLAGLLFHELAHQKLFANGDSDFDEAFATVVEEEGVRRWLKSGDRQAELAKYELSLRFEQEFHELLNRTRAQLRQLYIGLPARPSPHDGASPNTLIEVRRQKEKLFAQLQAEYVKLQEQWPEVKSHAWIYQNANNAKLTSEDTYFRLTPAFRRLLAQNQNDLEAFYSAAGRLARLPKVARQRELDKLQY